MATSSKKAESLSLIADDGIRAEWTRITPAMAKSLLSANEGNRNLRGELVAQYARDMKAGRWRQTGDGVRVSKDGRLIDGQHRLTAIIESGKPVEMFVFRNVPDEAQVAIDAGARRTAADHLGMYLGEDSATRLAAAARVAIEVGRYGTVARNAAVSTGEIVEWIDANPDIRDAVRLAGQVSRQMDAQPATVAYCALELARIDRRACLEFFYAAATKENMHRGDPRLTLSRRFADARRNRERLTREVQIGLIYRAWNAWVRGESLNFLRVRVNNGETVSIPKPIAPAVSA